MDRLRVCTDSPSQVPASVDQDLAVSTVCTPRSNGMLGQRCKRLQHRTELSQQMPPSGQLRALQHRPTLPPLLITARTGTVPFLPPPLPLLDQCFHNSPLPNSSSVDKFCGIPRSGLPAGPREMPLKWESNSASCPLQTHTLQALHY